MFYSAYDLQTGDYFSTGRNSKTRKDCVKDIVSFLIEGCEEDCSNMTKEDILSCFEVEIHRHKDFIPENY